MTRMDPRMAARRKVVQESHARRSLARLMRVLVFLAVVAGVIWAFRSPLLAVQSIEVRGAETVDVSAVVAGGGVEEGVPMMDVDLDAAAGLLEADPWVASAVVTRSWPQTIVVEIVERLPVAWAATADGWGRIAADGVVLEYAEVPDPQDPVLVMPGRPGAELAGDRDVVGVLEFLSTLPDELRQGARIEQGESGFEGTIGGYAVRIGSGADGREKALALTAVLETAPDEGSIITVIAPAQPAVLPPGAVPDEADDEANPEEG